MPRLTALSPLLFLPLAVLGCKDATAPDTGDTQDTGEPQVASAYAIVGTGQSDCYDASGNTGCPAEGQALYGQDAQYEHAAPDYTDNGDGTVTDLVTGLTWQQEQVDPMVWDEAAPYCEALELGGHDDWRLPSVKEGYSLIHFDGATGTAAPDSTGAPDDAVPYIDTSVFDFEYGSPRYIDVQFATTTVYVSKAFADDDGKEAGVECFFGVNHADGRIKCYPTAAAGSWQVRCVRGNPGYGENDLSDNGDGTITDAATERMWMQSDSGSGMDWSAALAWCEDSSEAGYDDWRLPTAKELQSIVDYSRSPDTTGSAAIDPLFQASSVTDLEGNSDFGWYWTSTTHLDGMVPGDAAAYVSFGEATGVYTGTSTGQELLLDVHGAGAQRSDPKVDTQGQYPEGGHGPQGDVRRVDNLVRCVRSL